MNTGAKSTPHPLHIGNDTTSTANCEENQKMAKKPGLSETATAHLSTTLLRDRLADQKTHQKAAELQEPLSDEAMNAIQSAGRSAVADMEKESTVASFNTLF